MLFSSFEFILLFLPITLIGYYCFAKISVKASNIYLLLCSFFFYGYWNIAFLPLLLFSILINYFAGIFISTFKTKKLIFIAAVCINIFLLCYFKYTDFFISGINRVFLTNLSALRIVLPLGISFYTFQAISYIADVYLGKTQAEKSILNLALYISLFPQLIAGPIVDHKMMIPQFESKENHMANFENLSFGFTLFAFALLKKIVIADRLSFVVQDVFSRAQSLSMTDAWAGVLAYTLQLYFDFSAYSEMAFALGKMLNITFPKNFDSPYQSNSIIDFWRRWHITLGSWIRNYIYIQLGGNRKGFARKMLNLFIAMTICGFWHGAGMQFILWGMLHGALLVINNCFQKTNIVLPSLLCRFLTFISVMALWILFRAASISDAVSIFRSLFDFHNFWIVNSISPFTKIGLFKKLITVNDSYVRSFSLLKALAMIFPLLFIVHFAPNAQKIVSEHFKINRFWLFLSIIMMITALFALFIQKNQAEFLYFQF